MKAGIPIVIAVLLVAVVAIAAGPFTNGGGKTVSVTPTATRVTFTNSTGTYNTLGSLSVANLSGQKVYAQVNTTLSAFSNAITAGITAVIPDNMAYTFDTKNQGSIVSICLQIDGAATGDVHLAGF